MAMNKETALKRLLFGNGRKWTFSDVYLEASFLFSGSFTGLAFLSRFDFGSPSFFSGSFTGLAFLSRFAFGSSEEEDASFLASASSRSSSTLRFLLIGCCGSSLSAVRRRFSFVPTTLCRPG